MQIEIKRIYEGHNDSDGYRILVDRLWPRGISKENAMLNEWLKDIAPSSELRKWFNHIPERYQEFKDKYIIELNHHIEELRRLKSISKTQKLTLLYSAKDTTYNQAVVLLEVLNNLS
ncbi:MAG TPA: DUF488 family protein [Candidatus Kapabacteria bacterium]|nr:DUF488 family protein [Candidatus Kapabacteria bacterium]